MSIFHLGKFWCFNYNFGNLTHATWTWTLIKRTNFWPQKSLGFPNTISNWNSKFLDHCVQGEKTGEKPETMTQKDAMMFPIIASCALGGLYMFFKIFDKEYINLLLSGYFFVLGVFALSHMAGPWLSRKIYKNLFVPLEDFRCIFTRYVIAKLFTSK